MGLLDTLRGKWKARKRRREDADIRAGLDAARQNAVRRTVAPGERIVIFSDQHKGARDGADDFQRCERAYNAALTYYHHLGWHLIELGDVEELWENRFEEVVAGYEETLRLAAQFHTAGRYTRVYGNHDLAWKDPELFADRMARFGYAGVTPLESVLLSVEGGDLLLAHGHQGTANSDRNAATSKFFVRRGWRPLQRLLNQPWNAPSVDWELRGHHAKTMAGWAQERGQVLITGHTHKPVFFDTEDRPEPPPETMAPEPDDDPQVAEALRLARDAWAKAERERLRRQRPAPLETPCYFNTGCCSFGDGDITGIEIADGEIRLVRWPADPKTDRRVLGEPLALVRVFELVRAGSR